LQFGNPSTTTNIFPSHFDKATRPNDYATRFTKPLAFPCCVVLIGVGMTKGDHSGFYCCIV
jgi:hypothetical protein